MPKKRIFLLILVIISLGLMTYQSKKQHLQPFYFLNNIFSQFHEIKHSIKTSIKAPFRRMLLREEENIKLKKEIAKLFEERQKFQEALFENKRLKELLALKEKEHRYVTAARVIAKGINSWSITFILDKGESDGISKDMTAITPYGLAGKISSVSDSHSTLLFLTDINFSAAVRLQKSRAEGVISGTGFKKCYLKYISSDEKIEKGDIIITSGLNSLFPEGIPVGYVLEVNKEEGGIFQQIEMLPFVDSSKLEEVVIISKA
ncbi:MAG: rod shape-determining protein MreC [Nitrospirota bacterium]